MSLPNELLELARELVERPPANPTQARLRRAVSTAYYALFHLLIDEAVSKWPIERHRNILARTFNHGAMKKACEEIVKKERRGDVPPGARARRRNFHPITAASPHGRLRQLQTVVTGGSRGRAGFGRRRVRGLESTQRSRRPAGFPGPNTGFSAANVPSEVIEIAGHGFGRGVASPLTNPSDHFTASRYMA